MTSNKVDWHGWAKAYTSPAVPGGERAKVALHIGPMPGRKGIALYVIDGNVGDPLAYFRNEAAAIRALAMLDSILLGMEKP